MDVLDKESIMRVRLARALQRQRRGLIVGFVEYNGFVTRMWICN